MPDAVARRTTKRGARSTPRPIDPEHSPEKTPWMIPPRSSGSMTGAVTSCGNLLDALAAAPDTRCSFPEVEDAIGGRVGG